MLSNAAASIDRFGIMFGHTSDPDRPFPSLPDVNGENGTIGAHEHLSYSFPIEDFPGWMLVAIDPRGFSYSDEDWRAMDWSNWSVVEGALGDYATETNYGGSLAQQDEFWRRNVADAHEAGAFIVDSVLLVAPIVGEDEGSEHRERVEYLASLADQLADYPILDECDYSRRESEAWDEWAESGGLRQDTTSELLDAGFDESLVEAIDDSWSDVWPIAMDFVDYCNGFSGECSPDFHEAIARAIEAGKLARFLPTSEDEDEGDK